jgi:hypothetical protein
MTTPTDLLTTLRETRDALRKLSFAAQTTGGTAGRDDDLFAAIGESELALAAADLAIAQAEREMAKEPQP